MAKEMLINVSEGEECRIALLEDGKLDEQELEELREDQATLKLAQQFDDALVAGVQVIRYGATLPYTERRMRSTERDLTFAGHTD